VVAGSWWRARRVYQRLAASRNQLRPLIRILPCLRSPPPEHPPPFSVSRLLRLSKRKGYEDAIRKNRMFAGNYMKYAIWEESQGEIQRYARPSEPGLPSSPRPRTTLTPLFPLDPWPPCTSKQTPCIPHTHTHARTHARTHAQNFKLLLQGPLRLRAWHRHRLSQHVPVAQVH
jgi:hypothetical protein